METNKLCAKVDTWLRDSHGLFDYESSNKSNQNIEISDNASIIRMENQIFQQPEDVDLSCLGNEVNTLLKVLRHQNNFTLLSINEPFWKVVKFASADGQELQENDTIKLGRICFVIGKVQIQRETKIDYPISIGEKEDSICRVCYCEGVDIDNPLITPCDCTGSLQFVHLNCIRGWIESKSSTQAAYQNRQASCEVCLCKIPRKIMQGGRKHQLLQIQQQKTPYITLELMSRDFRFIENSFSISFDKKNSIIIGRGHDCDIKIQDISVSRHHAVISFKNNKFYIEDHKSKFGTLIQQDYQIELGEGQNVALQFGRSLLTFKNR